MKDKLFNICRYILWGLMALIVIVVILFLVKGQDGVDLGIKFTYVLGVIAILAMLASPIYGVIIEPKSIKSILIALGLAGVVALVALLFSKGATLPAEYLEAMNISKGAESFVDWAMMCVYVLFGATIASVIFSAVWKLIK